MSGGTQKDGVIFPATARSRRSMPSTIAAGSRRRLAARGTGKRPPSLPTVTKGIVMTIQQSIIRAARPILYEEYATRRDNSIIAMDAHGCTDREIALELGLHPTTVQRVLRGGPRG